MDVLPSRIMGARNSRDFQAMIGQSFVRAGSDPCPGWTRRALLGLEESVWCRG